MLLPAAFVFCASVQSDVVFACDVAGHFLVLSSFSCMSVHASIWLLCTVVMWCVFCDFYSHLVCWRKRASRSKVLSK